MVANIMGQRALTRGKPAWWDMNGTNVFQEPLTAVEALERAGADFEVKTFPVQVPCFGFNLETDRVAIVRQPVGDDPKPVILGYAGKDYAVLQNRMLAEQINPLSSRWPVETLGVLGKGETIFISLDGGEKEIGQDLTKGYFVVVNYHTGGDSLRIFFTRVRIVCQNTLISGLKAATVSAIINHRAGVEDEFKFHVDIFERMKTAQQSFDDAMEFIVKKQITKEQVDQILEAAYPLPALPQKVKVGQSLGDVKKMVEEQGEKAPKTLQAIYKATQEHEYYTERQKGIRATALQLYDKFCDEFPFTAKTGWAIYNAIVECEDWRNGKDNVGQATLFGDRANTKAAAFAATLKV